MKRWMVGIAALGLLTGCDTVNKYFPRKTEETVGTEKKSPATVAWAGQAVAADTFIKIAKQADPAVVNIGTTKILRRRAPHPFFFDQNPSSPFGDFFGDDLFRKFFGEMPEDAPQMKQQSLGSGFILTDDGYIVTNNHVIEKADEITVIIGKDQEYKAKLVGADPKTDVALIRVEAKDKLKTLEMGDSDDLQVGEIVVAIGNPFGLSHTVTQGIVSAKERSIGFGQYDNFIQTDASINPGNSGGPLLNLRAEVVGINTAIVASAQGIGFAIPINLAKNIFSQLKEKGSVTRGWLGVYIQKVDPDLARSMGLKDRRGALVSSVQKNSPAAKVGIQSGDVVMSFDGKEIKEFNDLPRLVASTPVGKKVTIVFLRDGKEQKVEVAVGELKGAPEEENEEGPSEKPEAPSKPDQLGLTANTLTEKTARKLGLDSATKGVLVDRVAPDGAAAEKGVRRGDVIIEINRKRVESVLEYKKIVGSLKKGDTVLLLIKRGAEATLFVAFTL
ncbi:MAG TPA: DegQ family serine endoprotease [Bdellovibrionota bacterium]|nr:DegQ family serine endoprotease [Bdellovibrionota bacterium]